MLVIMHYAWVISHYASFGTNSKFSNFRVASDYLWVEHLLSKVQVLAFVLASMKIRPNSLLHQNQNTAAGQAETNLLNLVWIRPNSIKLGLNSNMSTTRVYLSSLSHTKMLSCFAKDMRGSSYPYIFLELSTQIVLGVKISGG